MGTDTTTLDLVIRGGDGVALNLTASQKTSSSLTLVGTLVDPETRPLVVTNIHVDISQELADGAHIERVGDFYVRVDDRESAFSWTVEEVDLGGGFVLQNAYASGESEEYRGFAVEDLIWSVGIGLAVGIAGLSAWRSHKRATKARADSERLWNECLERGGSPTIEYSIQDGATLSHKGPTITSQYGVRVRCDMPQSG